MLNFDTDILLSINGHHSPLMDSLMWHVSQPLTWVPLYAVLLGYLAWIYRGKKGEVRSWMPLLCSVLLMVAAVGMADYVSSGLLKPLVCRWRPSHEPALEGMLHLVNGYRGGQYGFPSSHAANTAAVTLLFYWLCKLRWKSEEGPLGDRCKTDGRPMEDRWKTDGRSMEHRSNIVETSKRARRESARGQQGVNTRSTESQQHVNTERRVGKVLAWGTLLGYMLPNCYSRMYLAVHYPTDILVGAAIGCLMAAGAAFAQRALLRRGAV